MMAFNPATGNMVLFGGFGSGGYRSDTWTWGPMPGAPTIWDQQSPPTSPAARWGAVMAYDPATGNMVLFGGADTSGTHFSDTWTWDGTTWTHQSPATSPNARDAAVMAYDPATGNMVLFGGFGSGYHADTLTWDGTTWTQQTPPTSPPARDGATMAYDPGTGNMVLFGGDGGSGYLSDTWTWDGTTWTHQSPATSPPARWGAVMAYDPATGNMVLFGGLGSGLFSETWLWTLTAVQPDAPTGLNATSGNAQASLTWTAPSSNGGSSITGYNIYVGTATGAESGTPVNASPVIGTSYTVTGLVNGTPYFFVVKAVNAVGESAASNEASTTPATVPGAPTGLSATSGNAEASLAWTAPSSDGGSPITGYNIYVGTATAAESGTPVNGTPVIGTSYTVTGLVNGTPYFFVVKAINAVGESVASNEASATPATAPDSPTGLSAVGGLDQVSLFWTAPASDGGNPITSYTATCTDGANSFTASTPDGSTTTVTVTGLAIETTYSCTVVAINAVGPSASSSAASATLTAPVPALSPLALAALALLLVGLGSWRIWRP